MYKDVCKSIVYSQATINNMESIKKGSGEISYGTINNRTVYDHIKNNEYIFKFKDFRI